MPDKNFCIANLTDSEKQVISAAEASFKASTGKDYVFIAWEEK